MATDRKLLWTLLILAATLLGWTGAVELERDWLAASVLAVALALLALLWLRRGGQGPREPP